MSAVDTSIGSPLALVRLLQLASPALPIGAYSYSQGLEWVIESGAVGDAADAERWIGDLLDLVMAPGEAAVLWRAACGRGAEDDWPAFRRNGTRGSAHRAILPSSPPKRSKWALRCSSLASTLNCSTQR